MARRVAERLGFGYLNTGSMYRAVALAAIRESVDPADATALTALARAHEVRLAHLDGRESVILDGVDVSAAVRDGAVTDLVSQVAAHADLREIVVDWQREILASGDWVADGRDIGTVVAPDAQVKVFLTASPQERAGRRHRELVDAGEDVDLDDVLRGIVERDRRDEGRAASPLTVADGATVVDTTEMDIEQVVERLVRLVSEGEGTIT